MKPTRRPHLAAAVLPALLLSLSLQAATVTKSATGTDLADPASWGGTVPASVDTAVWDATSLGAGLTLGTDASWLGLSATGALSDVSVSGAGIITLGTGGIDLGASTVNVTIANPVVLGGDQSWSVASGKTLTLADALSGSSALAKNGAGALTISAAQPSLTGPVTIYAGRVTLGANNSLGTASVTLNGGTLERNAGNISVANNITVGASGGTLLGRQVVDAYTNFSGVISGSGALTFQGLNQLSNTASTHSGSITISNASATYLRLSASEVLGNSSTVTMGGANANFRLDGGVTETIGSLAGSGNLFVSATGAVLPGTLKLGGDNSSTSYTGALNNNDGQLFLVKQGTGTFTLSPSSATFQGLTISGGTVIAGNGNYGTNATITLGDADTGASNVAFLTTTAGSSRPITVSASGTGTATVGSTTGAGGGNVVFSGVHTLNRATTITAASTDRTTWSGKITGNVGTLTFAGPQRIVLESANGLNDFTGDVVVSAGVLQVGAGNLTGENIPNASSVTVNSGAFLKLASTAGSAETINALNGSGTVRRHEGVSGLQTLVIGSANGSGSFTGILLNGSSANSLALVKNGTGTQTVAASGSHTASGGVTVNGGTLKFTGSANFDAGAIPVTQTYTVNAGAILEFQGDWLTRAASTYNITGGTLAFTKTTGDTTLSYVNNLNLTNGTVIGPGFYRIGNNTAATHTFSGDSGNVVSSGFGMVKNGAAQTVSLTVNDGAADADLLVSGVISDVLNFAGSTLNKQGAGKLVMTAVNTYSGPTIITAGTLQIGNGGTSGNISAPAVANSGTLAFKRSDAVSFANGVSGTGGLTQAGTGTLNLSGTNTYTGPTTVSSGRLNVTSSLVSSAVTVNGGTLSGTGPLGSVTVNAGGSVEAGSAGSGNLVASSLTLGTGATSLTVSPGATRIVADTLTASGSTSINLAGSAPAPGTYTLVDYVGSIGGSGFPAFALGTTPPRLAVSLVDNTANASIDLLVSGVDKPKWTGATNGTWDTSTSNWKEVVSGNTTTFIAGDDVLFDDSATGTTTVTLDTSVTTSATTFGNSSLSYTLTGAGSIGGTGSLTKSGAGGTVSIETINSFTGNVFLNGGAVYVTSLTNAGLASPLGAGSTVSFDGGVLAFTGTAGATNRSVVLNAGGGSVTTADTLALSGVVSGSGTLTKDGAGTVTLSAANTFSGGISILDGRLVGSSNTALGAGTITLGTGSANTSLYLGNRADVTNPVTVSAAGTGTVVIGADNTGTGANAATYFGLITLNRPTTFGTEVISDRLAFDGRITGNVGTLTVTGGARTTFLSTANDFTGDILVTGTGTVLQASVGSNAETIPDSSSVTLGTGAVLQLSSNGGTETIAGLNGSGTVRTHLGGTVAYGSSLTVGFGDVGGDFSGAFVNGNGPVALIKTGAGTQVLSGASANTGGITVTAGTVSVPVVNDSATAGPLGQGAVTLDGGTLAYTGATASSARVLALGVSGGTVAVTDAAANLTLTGALAANSLTKSGPGTLTLNALNTHGSTTVAAGTLVPAIPEALGSGAVSVTGGALDLNGQLLLGANPVSVGASGTLTGAGRLAVGTLDGTLNPGGTGVAGKITTTNDLTLGSTAVVNLELGGTAAGSFDVLESQALVVLGGTVNVSLINGFTPALGNSFDLIVDDSGQSGSATLGPLPALGSGLAWDTSAFNTTGVITVISTGPSLGSFNTSNFTVAEQGNAAISGPAADPDGDGISNVLEYAFASDPKAASRANLPVSNTTVSSGSTYIGCVYTRVKGATDLAFTVQFSSTPDSAGFTNAVEGVDYTLVSTVDNGSTETITIRDNTAVSPSVKRFVRILVTYP